MKERGKYPMRHLSMLKEWQKKETGPCLIIASTLPFLSLTSKLANQTPTASLVSNISISVIKSQ